MSTSDMPGMAQPPDPIEAVNQPSMLKAIYSQLSWRWPWYAIALCAVIIIGITQHAEIAFITLCAFTLIAVLITLKERIAEAVILPTALAMWTILQISWEGAWQMALAFSGLCVLLFLFQFVWQIRKPLWPAHASLWRSLATGGQAVIVLVILFHDEGPLAPNGLAQVGAAGLFVLALMVLCSGYAEQYQTSVRHWCNYLAGLLASATLSWESPVIWNHMQVGNSVEFVTIPLATYLTVIAPFLMRNHTVSSSKYIGYVCAIVGPALLLGPSFVLILLSGTQLDQSSAWLLLGESLGLFALGAFMRPPVYRFIGTGFILALVATIRMIVFYVGKSNQGAAVIFIIASLAILTWIGITLYLLFVKKP